MTMSLVRLGILFIFLVHFPISKALNLGKMFQKAANIGGRVPVQKLSSSGPLVESPSYSWDVLKSEVLATETGSRLESDRLVSGYYQALILLKFSIF